MAEHSTEITTLNTLIGTLLDSVEGYQKSAEDIGDQQLGQRFRARAQERQQAVSALQAAVSQLGGNPEDDATLLGGAHRVFVDLKAAVTGRDDKAILNEVERGEDYLKGKFKTALNNADLSPQARAAVDQAWQSVQAGHDEMSRLKHEWQGTSGATTGNTDQQSYTREQEYAQGSPARQAGGTYAGSDTAGGSGGPSMTTTDGYQQSGGGYPGTISPNDGSGSTVGGEKI